MKTMNLKIYSLLISIFALLTFSGCDSSSSPGQPAGETEAECLLNAGGYVAIEING
ncbi:hypothetical protein [Sulfurovum sp. AR]|uniref:hypothetical protein n=1 Tax=Sulfurovum sp. AR TaxID=1165841 RepID=UPI0002D6BFC0|nr:hypothetical protein [Sulfurovum sp. AR]